MACLDTTSEQILYYKTFRGARDSLHSSCCLCVRTITCEKLLLALCGWPTQTQSGVKGWRLAVCAGRRAERGPSRELNSLVLTHIDIKFTAMLSFIQVAINSLRFCCVKTIPRVKLTNAVCDIHPVSAINNFSRFV